ncbi:MAG: hypothetical protein P1S60_15075, partial [Anaerolineae bacterium]|nr:hypothetical protein [Anaerolineae bacterium]
IIRSGLVFGPEDAFINHIAMMLALNPLFFLMSGKGEVILNPIYIDDLVDGIYKLTQSDLEGAANIGTGEYVTVNHLVETIIAISGKDLSIHHVEGPVGVLARNFSKERMRSIGWQATTSLRDGMERTYAWVAEQVGNSGGAR